MRPDRNEMELEIGDFAENGHVDLVLQSDKGNTICWMLCRMSVCRNRFSSVAS